MANFQINGKPISKQTIAATRQKPTSVGLWGFLNTFVAPSQEIDVVATPSAGIKLERGKVSPNGEVREWQITARDVMKVKIEAKAASETWDSFFLDVATTSWNQFLTPAKRKFAEDMAAAGRAKAKEAGFPLSAMVACACSEGAWGTSAIYKRTGCPFNLQKPADWEYPKCEIETNPTENKEGEKAKPAPFCKATSLSDAARLWCEWIAHYPRESARKQLIGFANSPKAFVEHLFLVGFADNQGGENQGVRKSHGGFWIAAFRLILCIERSSYVSPEAPSFWIQLRSPLTDFGRRSRAGPR